MTLDRNRHRCPALGLVLKHQVVQRHDVRTVGEPDAILDGPHPPIPARNPAKRAIPHSLPGDGNAPEGRAKRHSFVPLRKSSTSLGFRTLNAAESTGAVGSPDVRQRSGWVGGSGDHRRQDWTLPRKHLLKHGRRDLSSRRVQDRPPEAFFFFAAHRAGNSGFFTFRRNRPEARGSVRDAEVHFRCDRSRLGLFARCVAEGDRTARPARREGRRQSDGPEANGSRQFHRAQLYSRSQPRFGRPNLTIRNRSRSWPRPWDRASRLAPRPRRS